MIARVFILDDVTREQDRLTANLKKGQLKKLINALFLLLFMHMDSSENVPRVTNSWGCSWLGKTWHILAKGSFSGSFLLSLRLERTRKSRRQKFDQRFALGASSASSRCTRDGDDRACPSSCLRSPGCALADASCSLWSAFGVPQRSILGSTFLLVYVNDAADVLPDSVYPATYADYTTLYPTLSSAESSATEFQRFQMGVNNLAHCSATWKIQFEPSKSQAILISRHRNGWAVPPVSFNGHIADDVDTPRLLGVTFDRHLSNSPHLRSTGVRATQRIGFLRKAFTLLENDGWTVAYKGVIWPMLEYCPLVWSGAASCYLERPEKVQKRALSLIGAGTIIDIDSLALRRTVSALCLLYKVLSSARLTTLQPLPPAQLTPVDNPTDKTPALREPLVSACSTSAIKCNECSIIPPCVCHDLELTAVNAGGCTYSQRPPGLQDHGMQSFKIKVYKHLSRTNLLWTTNACDLISLPTTPW